MFLKAKRGSTSPAVEKFSQYAEERGIPVKMVRRTVLDLLCKHGVHQGVCLEVTPLRPIDWKDGLSDEVPCTESQSLWLALEGIKDPMNLGAVLRSAHFLGVDGIVMTRRNSCPLTPVVSKASSGAMEVLDVFHTADLQSFLKVKILFIYYLLKHFYAAPFAEASGRLTTITRSLKVTVNGHSLLLKITHYC
uniref:rRNA methyltransferase 1, mitochondrial n=1 Tax=Varanus komodoensis TaxID=61221 RepID=A0A8D2LWX6_VARKO